MKKLPAARMASPAGFRARVSDTPHATRAFTYRKEFDVGDQESGEEEYKALVWVVSEIVEGKAWTNTLQINLG